MNAGTVSLLLLVGFMGSIVGIVLYFEYTIAKQKKLERWGLSDSDE